MIVKNYSIEELKQMWLEIFFSKQDKVTKASDLSVVNAIAFANSKLAQKINVNIAVVESQLFPEFATGQFLDSIAIREGRAPRLNANGSSTYIRVVGDPGTQYVAGTHTFTGSHGIVFELTANYTIPSFGYGYVKVRSQQTGSITNVEPLTINRVSPVPTGHSFCINEYSALGGFDFEDDDIFRERITSAVDRYATKTLGYLEQVLAKIDERVLKCYNYGFTSQGGSLIGVASVNGVDFTFEELDNFQKVSNEFLSLVETRRFSTLSTSITYVNVNWFPIDVSFRCDVDPTNIDITRKKIQVNLSKVIDFRNWKNKQKVEWDNLLEAVKNTDKVNYVQDETFFPHIDVQVPTNKLPRIRGFMMMNLDGSIISNQTGTLNPIFYPNNPDFKFQADVLSEI